MGESDLRDLFLRFRDHGDVAAFASVFDRTAEDLLELARRLTRSAHGAEPAEDLLQETFLVAIESRDAFDAARPIEPWLAGILAHRAAAARRRARRSPAAAQIDSAESPSPIELAALREFEHEVARAIDALPPSYRGLVEARIHQDATPAEIARDTGATGGVVRMRLHRGIALLRDALPHGLFASLLLAIDARVALGGVRRRIVEHAHSSLASTLSGAAALSGGLLVSKKLGLVIGALMLAAAGIALLRTNRGDEADLPPRPLAPAAVVAGPARTEDPAPKRELVAEPAPTIDPRPASSSEIPASYAAALAGVRGRLVEADGAPSAHRKLVAIEFDRDRFTLHLEAVMTALPGLEPAAHAESDSEGRFHFGGLLPDAVHAIGIDPGGPRATLRLVDLPLAPGVEVDLGDVVLGPVVGLSGRILDDDRTPIAGARVRIAPIPVPFLGSGVERVTPDTIVRMVRGGEPTLEALPIWMRDLIAHLPLPTATTDDAGRFEIAGAPPGTMATVVDAAGFVTTAFGPTPLAAGRARDLGDLELPRGRTLRGVVLDGERRPLAFAELAAGVAGTATRGFAFLSRRTVSDAAGRFTIDGIPDDRQAFVGVRPSPASHWQSFDAGVADSVSLELELADLVDHELRVSRSDGATVSAISTRLTPMARNGPEATVERNDAWAQPVVEPRPGSPGVFVLRRLVAGHYHSVVEIAGIGARVGDLEITRDHTATEIVFDPPRSLAVRVLDAATNAAIEHVEITALARDDASIGVASAFTDASGNARLGPLAIEESEPFTLLAHHPGYAVARLSATTLQTDGGEYVFRLSRGGSLAGRILVGGSPTTDRYLVVLRPALSSGAIPIPTFVATDAASTFTAENLRPLTYAYEVFPNFLTADFRVAASRLSRDPGIVDRAPEARGEVTIESGRRTTLDVEVIPPDSPLNGIVRGRVTCRGEPLRGAKVFVRGARSQTYRLVDADGRYEFDGVTPGNVEVQCCVDVKEPIAILTSEWRRVDLPRGGSATCDFRIGDVMLDLRVNEGGAPAPLVRVSLRTGDDENEWVTQGATATDGAVRLAANRPGAYRVIAHSESGYAVRTIELGDGTAANSLTLELEHGITVAGTVETTASALDRRLLRIRSDVNGASLVDVYGLDAKSTAFTFAHVPPGRLFFELEVSDGDVRRTEVDVTVDRLDLVLKFP